MNLRSLYLSPFAFCALLLGIGSAVSPVAAQLVLERPTPTRSTVPDPASEAAKDQQNFLAALAQYEEKERQHLVQTQDDAPHLLATADYAVFAGHKDQAFALCERVMQLPAKEGAHPPDLLPGPVDWRGEARWKMAQIRRSQGRFAEALALYQLNRSTYPRDDGCVVSGAALQEMMMVEGECLEHLGRYGEAANLYLAAALHLDPIAPAEAMRRLFDMYQACNQLPDLERIIEREKTTWKQNLARQREEVPDMQEDYWKGLEARSAFPTMERVLRLRKAAHNHQWTDLTTALLAPPPDDDATSYSMSGVNTRESLSAFGSLDARSRAEALQSFQNFLKRTNRTSNFVVETAVTILQGPKGGSENVLLTEQGQMLLGIHTQRQIAPRQPAVLPRGLKLPTELSSDLEHLQ